MFLRKIDYNHSEHFPFLCDNKELWLWSSASLTFPIDSYNTIPASNNTTRLSSQQWNALSISTPKQIKNSTNKTLNSQKDAITSNAALKVQNINLLIPWSSAVYTNTL